MLYNTPAMAVLYRYFQIVVSTFKEDKKAGRYSSPPRLCGFHKKSRAAVLWQSGCLLTEAFQNPYRKDP